jgi:hypothetical protein
MRPNPLKRLSQLFSSAMSSCETGWLSTAFLTPALLGSIALLFYVESIGLPGASEMAGGDADESPTVAFIANDAWLPAWPPLRNF